MFHGTTFWTSCELYHPSFPINFWVCLTSQSWPKNMSVPFKSVTAASNCSLWLLISISRSATLVTFPSFVSSALKTLNKKFIGFVWILLSLTNYLLISMCVQPESTSAFTLRFFSFFVFTFACTFNSLSMLLCWFGITYFFREVIGKVSCIVPTWDHLQNPTSCCYSFHHCLHCLILLVLCVSSLITFFCNS